MVALEELLVSVRPHFTQTEKSRVLRNLGHIINKWNKCFPAVTNKGLIKEILNCYLKKKSVTHCFKKKKGIALQA